MKRSDVKDVADLISCSLDELNKIDKGQEVDKEIVNVKVTLEGHDAIYFRDCVQASKIMGKDAATLIKLMVKAGVAATHGILRDKFEEASADLTNTRVLKQGTEELEAAIKDLENRGASQSTIDFIKRRMSQP